MTPKHPTSSHIYTLPPTRRRHLRLWGFFALLGGWLTYSCINITWQPPTTGTNQCDPKQNASLNAQPDWKRLTQAGSTPACLQIAWGDPSLSQARGTLVRINAQGELRAYDPNVTTPPSIKLPAESKGKSYRTMLFIFSPDHQGDKIVTCQTTMAKPEYSCFATGQESTCAFYMQLKPNASQPNTAVAIDGDNNLTCKPFFRTTTPPGENPQEQTPDGGPDTLKPDDKPDTVKPDLPGCTGTSCKWLNSGGGSSIDFAAAIAMSNTGHIYLAGMVSGTGLQFPGTGSTNGVPGGEFFLAALSADGSFKYLETPTSPPNEPHWSSAALDMALSPDGKYLYVVGLFADKFDYDKNKSTELDTTTKGTDRTDAMLLRFDITTATNPTLAASWRIGGPGHDLATGVAVSKSGDIYVVGLLRRDPAGSGTTARSFTMGRSGTDKSGSFDASADQVMFLAKVNNSSDTFDWYQLFGATTLTSQELTDRPNILKQPNDRRGPKVLIDQSKDGAPVYIVGQFKGSGVSFGTHKGTSQGGYDMFALQSKASDGTIEKLLTAGSPDDDGLRDVTRHPSDTSQIYVAGSCQGVIKSGTTTIQNCEGGTKDSPKAFVARLNFQQDKWDKAVTASGTEPSIAHAIDVDASGALYVAGEFQKQFIPMSSGTAPAAVPGSAFKGGGGFVIKLDAELTHQWHIIGGSNATASTSNAVLTLSISPTGAVLSAGILEKDTDWTSLNKKNSSHYGNFDAFVSSIPLAGP